MRTLTTAESTALASGAISQSVRVSIKDYGGTFRDLTTYPGVNLVNSVTIREDIDSPGPTVTIELLREMDGLSVAPLMEGSPLNLGFTYGGTYHPLIDLAREVKIECSTDPADTGTPANWIEIFRGYVDRISPAEGENLLVECAGLYARLRDTFIEKERVYSRFTYGGATRGARIFSAYDTTFSASVGGTGYGEFVIPSDSKVKDAAYFYEVTTGGTTSTTVEPTWPSSGTVTNSPVVFTYRGAITDLTTAYDIEDVIQAVLDDNGLDDITLVIPAAAPSSGSPSFTILPYKQQREGVLSAIQALVGNIAWDIRYLWDSGSGTWKFTLYNPDRSAASTVYTFGADDYDQISGLELDITDIRNVCTVIYGEANTRPDGSSQRYQTTSTNSASVTLYGRRYMEIQEDSEASHIDTLTEADALADYAVEDCGTPRISHQVDLVYGFPWVEINDYYTFSANGIHYDTDQDLAVMSYEHRWAEGVMRTTLTCGGKPGLSARQWLRRASGEATFTHSAVPFGGPIGIEQLAEANTIGSATFRQDTSTAGGTKTKQNAKEREMEWYISESNASDPTDEDFYGSGGGATMTVTGLTPGKDYYVAARPKYPNASKVVLGEFTDWVPFTAGQGGAGHLESEVNWNQAPLNGGFETWTTSTEAPQHWVFYDSGNNVITQATEFSQGSGDGARTGTKYLIFDDDNKSEYIMTEFFEVTAGRAYNVSWNVKEATDGAIQLKLSLIYYTYAKAVDSTVDIDTFDLSSESTGTWRTNSAVSVAPSTARYAKLKIYNNNVNQAGVVHVDNVRIVDAGEDWIEPSSLDNSWANYGGSNAVVAYRRDAAGRVHLKGFVKDGTPIGDGYPIFTLPAQYRPPKHMNFVTIAGTGCVRIEIQTDGEVTPIAYISGGSNGYVSLDGISFDTWE